MTPDTFFLEYPEKRGPVVGVAQRIFSPGLKALQIVFESIFCGWGYATSRLKESSGNTPLQPLSRERRDYICKYGPSSVYRGIFGADIDLCPRLTASAEPAGAFYPSSSYSAELQFRTQ